MPSATLKLYIAPQNRPLVMSKRHRKQFIGPLVFFSLITTACLIYTIATPLKNPFYEDPRIENLINEWKIQFIVDIKILMDWDCEYLNTENLEYSKMFQDLPICKGQFKENPHTTYYNVVRYTHGCPPGLDVCPGKQSDENKMCVRDTKTECPINYLKVVENDGKKLENSMLISQDHRLVFSKEFDSRPLIKFE